MSPLHSIATLLLSAAMPQSAQVPAPAQDRPIAILHATVHTVASEGPQTLLDGYVVFDRGTIVAVGSGNPPALPADALTFDATGLHVAPGFIATMSGIGLVETLQVPATDDRSEAGSLHPEVVAATAINPDSDLIPVARAAGVLLSMTVPSSGLLSGRASALRLDGWTPESIAIDRDVGVVVNWPLVEPVHAWWTKKGADEQAKSIKKDLESLERFVGDARAYVERTARFPETPRDQRFEAMRGALSKSDPVFITCGSASQIESALAWSVRNQLRAIIVGSPGIEASIPLIKAHAEGVIIAGVHRLPGRSYEKYDAPFTLAATLRDAGIPFAIATTGEPAHERDLPHHAGTAAAYGLTPDEALRAITRSAAELAGIGERYGSLAKGKSATLIVTSGDPLEMTSDVLLAFIDGRTIDLTSRQTRLLAKYREKYKQLGIDIAIKQPQTAPPQKTSPN
ncbi:MAG: amidohydrolase family protein [Phycisphaerae bacterium]|nr:amidohydrolase family protein [Phycisphaerae bacterium]